MELGVDALAAASTPKISMSGSSRKGWKRPMALGHRQWPRQQIWQPSLAGGICASRCRSPPESRAPWPDRDAGLRCADAVEGVLDIGDPVAQRLVEGVLEVFGRRSQAPPRRQAASCEDMGFWRSSRPRPVDDAVRPSGRRPWRSPRHAAGAGLGDDARLPMRRAAAPGPALLILCAGVIQLFALEVDFAPPDARSGARQ